MKFDIKIVYFFFFWSTKYLNFKMIKVGSFWEQQVVIPGMNLCYDYVGVAQHVVFIKL